MKLQPREWSAALALMDRLLEHPTNERSVRLDRMDCPESLKQVVHALLANRQVLDDIGFLEGRLCLGLPNESAQRLSEGATVGDYRLLRQLGEGGMGTVWLAERTDELRRRVALKLPHAGFGQDTLTQRLLRERDILASLEHPHIARLYDVGIGPQDTPFLVLEHIEGLPLLMYCESVRLSVPGRLALFGQVLRAVQYAHAKLVLHRDIKPSNILVDAAGDAKLLDFGIAKVLGDAGASDSALTVEGGRPLTPDYAAPEQITGQPLGTACDIYSLGVLLFELLTGQRPYRLPHGTRGELEDAILAVPPRRPSEAVVDDAIALRCGLTAEQLRHALRGDLDAIVLMALRKSPAARYPSADAFAQDIQRHLARMPVQARPEGRLYRLQRFVQRNTMAVVSAAAVVMALGAGLAGALWQANVAHSEAAKAEAIKDFLIGLFESNGLDQVDTWRKRRQNVQQVLEQSAEALQAGLSDQLPLKAELEGVVGRLLNDLDLAAPAAQVRERRILSLRQAGAPVEEQGEALRDWAQSLALHGDTVGARRALETAESLLAGSNSVAAQVQRHAAGATIGKMDLFDARPDAAARRIEPAVLALSRLAPRSNLHADALSAQAILRQAQGNPEQARQLLAQAFDIKKALFGGSPVLLARERYAHATLLRQMVGEFGVAEQELRVAWDDMKSVVGPDHLNSAVIEQQLARMLLERGQVEAAQSLLSHASDVFERHAAELDPTRLVESRLYQVEAFLANGRLGAAEQAIDSAVQRLRSGTTSATYWNYYAEMLYSDVLVRTGDFQRAIGTLDTWHTRFVREYGADHPSTLDVELRMARAHEAAGELERASALVESVSAKHAAGNTGTEWVRDHARWRMASLLLERERFAEALPVAQAVYTAANPAADRPGDAETQGYAAYLLARAHAGLGRHTEARAMFEQSIARLRSLAYEHNPMLAQVRAAYAWSLVDLGEPAAAREQVELAATALQVQDRAGPQFQAGLLRARAKLAGMAAPGAGMRIPVARGGGPELRAPRPASAVHESKE